MAMPTEWKLHDNFPDLKDAKTICLDIETRDPTLKEKGPGVRRDGQMVGLALATNDGFRAYYPFCHEYGEQFSKETVIKYARNQLTRPSQPKLGANILYDLDYLYEEGVKVTGPFYDVQVAEPLLNENRGWYNLDSLAEERLGEGKDEELMDSYARERGWKGKSVKYLYRMPPSHTGHYAEADVDRTLRVFNTQVKDLKREGLYDLFNFESRLIPLLLHMRRVGVRVDVAKAEKLYDKTGRKIQKLEKEIKKLSGVEVDIWAARSLAKAFDKLGLKYPTTAKNKEPSFTAQWLERHSHPVANLIREARKLDKFAGTFLKGQILELAINERVHPQFNQLKGDNYGTVTGRFSGSLPNLQFIPNRDPELGPLTRSLFIPELGYLWGRADYSQIEIRILAHYARGRGAKEIVQAFIEDPFLDYHQWCADQRGVDRKRAKTVNFGIIYGMGVALLASQLGIPYQEAKDFIDSYYAKLPFLKSTTQAAMRVAGGNRGYVQTILGRRRRFDTWEPRDYGLAKSKRFRAKSAAEVTAAIREYNEELREEGLEKQFPTGAKRAFTYKAFNAVDQGSAADVMKAAMIKIWDAGICNVLPTHITNHDELDVSVPDTAEGKEAFEEMGRIMTEAIPLKVPVVIDTELGENWGKLKDFGRIVSSRLHEGEDAVTLLQSV
jgi:DNA polymerase I-like protein with 3'-5' exonuclease and polymerase domains